MNGGTLKWAFSVIVWTFCIILLSATFLCLTGRVSVEVWEKVIGNLGVIGFFTMIGQSFLHADANKDGIPDATQITKGEKDEKSTTSDSTAVVSDTSKG